MFYKAILSTIFALSSIVVGVEALPAKQDSTLAKRADYAPSPILPNANSVWEIGSIQEVTWNATNVPDGTETIPWIDLLLYQTSSYGSAEYVLTLAQNVDAHAGRAGFNTPDVAPGSYFVMVGAWGQSSAHFQIVAPPYIPKILTPNQNTVWTIGSQETITWDTSNLPDHVGLIPDFQLWTKASYGSGIEVATLVSDIDPTLGSIDVTVPSDIAPGTYFIVVIFGDNAGYEFQIVAA